MMVGNNLKEAQLQQIVDKTILFADKDNDGMISFDEFCQVSSSSSPSNRFTWCDFRIPQSIVCDSISINTSFKDVSIDAATLG